MKIKNLIYGMLVAAALCSCSDYLDIKPYGKTIPKTAEEFSALVHNIMLGVDEGRVAESQIIGSVSLSSTFEMVSDNMEVNLTEFPGGSLLRVYIGDILSSKQSDYSHLYETIRNCNIVLGEFKDGRDTREGQDLIGTAYALRGICYYQLLRQFCPPANAANELIGVPLVQTFDMEERPIRSTYDETVAQVERDLKAALDCHVSNEMYRINDDVCTGYLARLYFWTGQYAQARTMARRLMEKYPLLEGEEYKAMMQTQYGLNGNMLIKGNLMNSSQSSISGEYNVWQYRPLSVRFVSLFTEKERDVRYTLFVGAKRKNAKTIFACMRAAEMYLIAMESNYHLGDTQTALDMLNDFRRHRITDVTDYTLETLPEPRQDEYITQDAKGAALTPLIYAILAERRKELYMEGDRFFELKRNGRPEFWVANRGLKYTTRRFMYTFPLPVNDTELQPSLVQNPGYEEVY